MKVSLQELVTRLGSSTWPFTEVFGNDKISLELYKPLDKDNQQPHDQDEIYVVVSGAGIFNHNGIRYPFGSGDLFFVAAKEKHYFETFTDDFITWVIFLKDFKIQS